jgi:predicted transcriptional regulator
MIAVSLLDAVTRADESQAIHARTAELAGQLIDASLAERRRIRQLEAEFAPAESSDAHAAMDIERSIHSLYTGWVTEAEQILLRVRRLISSGLEVRDAAEMEDAYASTLSRLKFTPEKTARGMAQAHRGEFTPAEDLRDELRTRIRS